jgi:hypothetical protein
MRLNETEEQRIKPSVLQIAKLGEKRSTALGKVAH